MGGWSPRYSVFSITGYTIDEPIQRRLLPFRVRLHDPVTTWYVTDNCDCGRVMDAFGSEHEARALQASLAAEDAHWEKRQQIATNGAA
jgi:hypothetical protein